MSDAQQASRAFEPATLRAEIWRACKAPRLRALALAILVTYAYFVSRPAWNQNSRFALTQALVEDASPIIDRFESTTGDKSFREGHFYSDKAPGLSVMATVPYALFYAIRSSRGGQLPAVDVVPLDPIDLAAERIPPPDRMKAGDRLRYNRSWRIGAYICRVLTVLPLAGLGWFSLFALAFALARARGRSRLESKRLATWSAAVYGLATPAFAYAVGFYGHRPVADLLIFAAALLWLSDSRDASKNVVLPLVLGSALGLAVCIEYPAAIPVAMIWFWCLLRWGWRGALKVAVAGLPWAIALALYHRWAFGSALSTGYDFVFLEEFASGMKVRYGIHAPDPHAAFELLFGSYRGLFALSPVLLVAVWGLAQLRAAPIRLAVAICLFYLGLNAGYYMWDGGAAFGPRHLLPALPFLCLGLVPAFERVPRLTFALAAWSAFVMLLGAYAGPEAPNWGNPVWDYAFPEFANFGQVGSNSQNNLGRFLGLPGPLSLLPLAVFWLLFVPPASMPRSTEKNE